MSEVVLWSEFVPPDAVPDRHVVGELRPEDDVRIAESEPGVVGEPAWTPTELDLILAR